MSDVDAVLGVLSVCLAWVAIRVLVLRDRVAALEAEVARLARHELRLAARELRRSDGR